MLGTLQQLLLGKYKQIFLFYFISTQCSYYIKIHSYVKYSRTNSRRIVTLWVLNIPFITLYGIITGSLSADYLCAGINWLCTLYEAHSSPALHSPSQCVLVNSLGSFIYRINAFFRWFIKLISCLGSLNNIENSKGNVFL